MFTYEWLCLLRQANTNTEFKGKTIWNFFSANTSRSLFHSHNKFTNWVKLNFMSASIEKIVCILLLKWIKTMNQKFWMINGEISAFREVEEWELAINLVDSSKWWSKRKYNWNIIWSNHDKYKLWFIESIFFLFWRSAWTIPSNKAVSESVAHRKYTDMENKSISRIFVSGFRNASVKRIVYGFYWRAKCAY